VIERLESLDETLKAIPGNLEEFGGAAAPYLYFALGVAVVVIVVWTAIKLRPRPRIGYAMIPDPNFEPSLEDVIRWAAGLASARSAVGVGPDSHRFVRLTLCSDVEGNLVSLIGLNPRARSIAERNGYAGVDLADPVEVLGPNAPAWLPPAPPADPSPSPLPSTDGAAGSGVEALSPSAPSPTAAGVSGVNAASPSTGGAPVQDTLVNDSEPMPRWANAL